jgi:RNA polymerase sigma-B factor
VLQSNARLTADALASLHGYGQSVPQQTCASRRTDELDLLRRSAAGDVSARDALVVRFLPLARSVAKRYAESSEPFDDLLQVACVGLVNAIARFDPDRGVSFVSFAVPTMLGEVKRHFRDRTWTIHIPRGLNELSLVVEQMVRKRTARDGHAPTVDEISQTIGVGHEAVLEALDVGRARRLASLDAPVSSRRDGPQTIGDTFVSATAQHDRDASDARLLLEPLLATLAPREQLILRLRYERDMTQAEIGELVGVSQMQISRLLRRSIARMSAVATPPTTA